MTSPSPARRWPPDRSIFDLTVDNRCPYVVENVYAPYLGDMRPPSASAPFSAFVYDYGTNQEWPCRRTMRTALATMATIFLPNSAIHLPEGRRRLHLCSCETRRRGSMSA